MSKEQQLKERRIKQQFFNMIVNRMLLQGKPGVHGNVLGLRAGDGTRCSLGWLITESFYRPEFEAMCPNMVMIEELGMPKLGYQFYDDLQEAHDKSATAKEWWPAFVREMRKLATKHFLDPSSLTLPKREDLPGVWWTTPVGA